MDTITTALSTHGLLLLQDKNLPSVVGLLTGEAVGGSWWAHPMAHRIFACVQQLRHRPDALAVHLVDGKVTFLHRRLWPALLAVAESAEDWQMRGLSAEARELLRRVEQESTVHATGAPARQLQQRLLVHGDEEHTASGSHGQVLQTWSAWRAEHGVSRGTGMKPFEGQLQIETALKKIGGDPVTLPWKKRTRRPQ